MAGHPDQPGPDTMTLDFAKAREAMVEQQVRPWDVLDPGFTGFGEIEGHGVGAWLVGVTGHFTGNPAAWR